MNVALYPADAENVADGLALAGATVVPTGELSAEDKTIRDADVLVVVLEDQPMRRLRELTRIHEDIGLPVMVVAGRDQLALLESADGMADFIIDDMDPVEFRLRLRRLFGDGESTDRVVFKDLELNLLTYQASIGTEPLDLTFMEYELLRFLAENPGRVWSREQLLSKVWGYDYYGGARTVDVHVRRLRSKLGEERSSWITTVRSVGYRLG